MSNRVEGSPGVYHTAELQESCRIIEAAAAKRASGDAPEYKCATIHLHVNLPMRPEQ